MKKETKVFQPTEAVKNNILRGIALKSKYYGNSLKDNQNFKSIKVMQEAIEKGFTLDTIKNVYTNLKDSKVDFNRRLADGSPSEEIIKHYIQGGSAGLAWAKLVLKSQGILNTSTKIINNADISKEADDKVFGTLEVKKSVEPVLKQLTYIAMVPDEIDLHGDVTSADEVRKAKESFNKSKMQPNLCHVTATDSFSIIESYLSPVDFVLEDKFVQKGTWLVTLQVHDDALWESILKGEFVGVSIGAIALVEELED